MLLRSTHFRGQSRRLISTVGTCMQILTDTHAHSAWCLKAQLNLSGFLLDVDGWGRNPGSIDKMAGKFSESSSPSPVRAVSDQVEERSCGFECEFVPTEKPPDSECPVCLQVLREPYQVSCCGKSFCRACIEPIKYNKKPCPTCNEENFDSFHDKRLQQSLYGFLVVCSHRKEGCEWRGELGQFDKHLNLKPPPEKQIEGCQFAVIRCLFCSQPHQRSKIPIHQNECPKRPFSCEYCQYNSDYEDIINNHWPVCGFHPVECPNMCGASPQRQNLEQHAFNDCPLTVISCDFQCVGCEVRLPRKAMSDHLNENTVTHVNQLLGYVKNQNLTFCKEQDKSQEQIAGLRNAQDQSQEQIAGLRNAQDQSQEQIAGLRNAQDQSQEQIAGLRNAQDQSQEQIAGLRNAQDQSHREIRELKKYQNQMQKCIWPLLLWIILPAVVAVVGISIEEVNSLEQHLEEQMGLIANIPEELLPLIMKDNWLEQELQRKEEFFGELTKNMSRLEQELQRKEELFGGLTEKVSKLEQELQRKEELFGGLTEKVSKLEQELQRKEELFGGLTEKVSKLEQELQRKEELFGGLTKKVSKLEQELQRKEELFGGLTEKMSKLEQKLQRKEELFGGLTEKVSKLEQELQRKEELFGGLTEKVSKLEQELQRKEELFGGLTEKMIKLEDLQRTFIYMPNFETHKEASEPWDSPPFYSHPSLGYKMCLRVDANGARYCKGTHVSVRMYLMRGEFDDHLKWPFRADVTIELLDQQGNERHHKTTIKFHTERVKDGRIFSGGMNEAVWGRLNCIHHNKLKPKYIKNDSLQFKILVKVLRV